MAMKLSLRLMGVAAKQLAEVGGGAIKVRRIL